MILTFKVVTVQLRDTNNKEQTKARSSVLEETKWFGNTEGLNSALKDQPYLSQGRSWGGRQTPGLGSSRSNTSAVRGGRSHMSHSLLDLLRGLLASSRPSPTPTLLWPSCFCLASAARTPGFLGKVGYFLQLA